MSIKTEQVKQIIMRIGQVLEENKAYLTDLDAAIGDADHGINLAKGFKAVESKLETTEMLTIGDVLKTTAMALISNVGGASGPLYGTFFLKMAGELKDHAEINAEEFSKALFTGIEGVQSRGKAVQGEKTMLDVLIPAATCFQEAISANKNFVVAWEESVVLGKKCVEETKNIAATKGRASYLGERSIGHIDPGAMSSYLMLKTLLDFLKEA